MSKRKQRAAKTEDVLPHQQSLLELADVIVNIAFSDHQQNLLLQCWYH